MQCSLRHFGYDPSERSPTLGSDFEGIALAAGATFGPAELTVAVHVRYRVPQRFFAQYVSITNGMVVHAACHQPRLLFARAMNNPDNSVEEYETNFRQTPATRGVQDGLCIGGWINFELHAQDFGPPWVDPIF
ncbi:MAG: hypothetical protein JKY37_30570, partial [Nannocystaceae bacterium]|nr:hypothetical protein [Nannocystaceae bacterium]